MPSEFDNYNKYIIAVIKQNGEKITKVLPIVDNIFYISSDITYIAGNWAMYLMCRENEIDIEAETIDISAKNGEHVFISDGFIGIVANSSIEKELVENTPIDTNLQLVYDDLLALKNELIEKLNTPTSYNDLVDVPKEFKPISHKHVVKDITDFPTSTPANGGDASTVNGHTVETDVPEGAVFTDTVYVHLETHPASMITGLPTKVSEFENDKNIKPPMKLQKLFQILLNLLLIH